MHVPSRGGRAELGHDWLLLMWTVLITRDPILADLVFVYTDKTAAAFRLRQCSSSHLLAHGESDDRETWRRAARFFYALLWQHEQERRHRR